MKTTDDSSTREYRQVVSQFTISAARLLPSLRIVSRPGAVEDQPPASNIGRPLASIIDDQPPAARGVLAPVVRAHQRPRPEVGEAGEGIVQRSGGQQSRDGARGGLELNA